MTAYNIDGRELFVYKARMSNMLMGRTEFFAKPFVQIERPNEKRLVASTMILMLKPR